MTGVEVEDLAFGLVELENGAIIEITSSMIAATEQPPTLELYAEKGTALYRAGLRPRLELRGVRLSPPKPPVRGLHALQRSLAAFMVTTTHYMSSLTPGVNQDAFAQLGLSASAAIAKIENSQDPLSVAAEFRKTFFDALAKSGIKLEKFG